MTLTSPPELDQLALRTWIRLDSQFDYFAHVHAVVAGAGVNIVSLLVWFVRFFVLYVCCFFGFIINSPVVPLLSWQPAAEFLRRLG